MDLPAGKETLTLRSTSPRRRRNEPESTSMSLKAKIEAVIYAAEEPVTLAQMVSLLGQEAQAELDRITSAQRSLALESGDVPEQSLPASAEPEDMNQEIFGGLEEASAPAQDEQTSSDAVLTGAPTETARDERGRARALREFLRSLLDELVRDYASSERGLEIREVAGGFRLATKPEYHDAVRGFVKSLKPPLKLSLQALETLAVVAYKQPVTAPEVFEIRGVDSGGVLGSLMARKLVTTAGRKQVIGRPILYKTTKDFLLRFGLRDINELPSIEEFEKMAGELADTDAPITAYQEEIPMTQRTSAESAHADPELARGNESIESSITGADLEEERDATELQADGDGATVETVAPDGRMAGAASPKDSLNDTDTSEAGMQQSSRNELQE